MAPKGRVLGLFGLKTRIFESSQEKSVISWLQRKMFPFSGKTVGLTTGDPYNLCVYTIVIIW